MGSVQVTRGSGLLEGLLARLRQKQADKLIGDSPRDGRMLDIGSGTFPLTLTLTPFREKYGLDRGFPPEIVASFQDQSIFLTSHDLEHADELPYESQFFDVVTMLAVVEHLDRSVLARLCREVSRVLRPGGRFIVTTPAVWTEPILTLLSALGLLSKEEIEEHRPLLSRKEMALMMQENGLVQVRSGTFEFFLNTWFMGFSP